MLGKRGFMLSMVKIRLIVFLIALLNLIFVNIVHMENRTV